jgi:hypothetical protein
LGTLGHAYPLPPPTSIIQVILACIKNMEFHKFVQAMDMEAINIVGKDGETPLLILEMIAIQNWMHLLEISNTKC